VRIPSGDLAPARKHRRYGRRRRSPWPAVLVVLLLVGVAGGAYAYSQRDTDSDVGSVAQASPCPAPAPVATRAAAKPVAVRLPAPGAVRFRLLNGTGRDGLARIVGNELARRGFQVAATINAPKPLPGASHVTFGPGARAAATLVGLHVLGGQLIPVPAAPRGAVEVTLGSSFIRLRTAAEVRSAAAALAHPAKPVVRPQPKPSAGCG
jgi:hypothetical protein